MLFSTDWETNGSKIPRRDMEIATQRKLKFGFDPDRHPSKEYDHSKRKFVKCLNVCRWCLQIKDKDLTLLSFAIIFRLSKMATTNDVVNPGLQRSMCT